MASGWIVFLAIVEYHGLDSRKRCVMAKSSRKSNPQTNKRTNTRARRQVTVGPLALTPKISNAAANAAADALCALLNNGYLRIYDGSQPTDADTAIGAQVLLAELRFGATAFGAAVAGVATANAITSDSAANATGTASWFRALKSDGTTVVMDGSVGTSGANLNINSTAIQINAAVSVSSYTYTVQKG